MACAPRSRPSTRLARSLIMLDWAWTRSRRDRCIAACSWSKPVMPSSLRLRILNSALVSSFNLVAVWSIACTRAPIFSSTWPRASLSRSASLDLYRLAWQQR
ncbi:hypothetical protein SPRG_20268 [Saprolegnia parasitica CBS 223.65]|uniref:Uncharacterized protein n=1 Tax=Saprolegnia parasitica (strain CBS 223.65) TaxID=695850 RepID=A0A067CG08_SAPPC|nr:hypothetical protein SPRG_20268 [Saprolegnia parasitica CBS 223.65]KDO28110.1 hypothetical protein SPRG_20268 [Saprolegnia parasitica CBS 223.65]|eukprot:XP_012201251.1 hypothetical protein SPRG_20268 [Saprolegnia parasitica CBS 223.65]